MTSAERREARYQRRRAARLEDRRRKVGGALDFDSVFTFPHLYRSALMCYRGVSWKASVQAFKCRGGINVARRLRELRDGVFHLRKSPEFITRERGHERRINSIHIVDRVPQKCNSYFSLKPVLHRSLIYDNYASQEGKGTDKARARLKCQLERHIRRYGMTGGMIIFDFKGFFDSIQHGLVRWILDRNYVDRRIIGMNMRIVRQAREKVGLVLGSENSQDFAISTPSSLDHFIREVLRIDGSGRYMDDGYLIHHDYERLKEAFRKICEFAASLGFRMNLQKSRLIRFGRPFTMLKRKYSFDGKRIIVRPVRESVIRARRKIKKLYRRFLRGTMRLDAGINSLNAWKASLRGCSCHKIVRSVEQLYDSLYINRWLKREEERKPCTTKSYRTVRSSMLLTA